MWCNSIFAQVNCNNPQTGCYTTEVGNTVACEGQGQLLPDLSPSYKHTEEAHDLKGHESFSKTNQMNMQFGTRVASIGDGPLELRFTGKVYCGSDKTTEYNANDVTTGPSTAGYYCDKGIFMGQQIEAFPLVKQVIYKNIDIDNDNNLELVTEERPAGYTEYAHFNHNHFHWAGWSRTTIRIGDGNRDNWQSWPIVGTGEKTGFAVVDLDKCVAAPQYCLTDNIVNVGEIEDQATLDNLDFGGQIENPADGGSCPQSQADEDGLYFNDHQTLSDIVNQEVFGGISVGRTDTYGQSTQGQFVLFENESFCNNIDYYLVTEIDPDNKILESNENNNVSVSKIDPANFTDEILFTGSELTTITTNRVFKNDIIVPAGKTLFIAPVPNGPISIVTIRFTGEHRIVVEKGGKLIMKDAKITTTCDQWMWEGIQVWGAQNKIQPGVSVSFTIIPPPFDAILPNVTFDYGVGIDHGFVYMENSVIENARNGIRTLKVDNWGQNNQAWNLSQSNGIVVVKDSEFRNNFCSVILRGDNIQTSCKIENTAFIIDDDFHSNPITDPNNPDPDFQLYMKNVVGLNITDVVFDNQATQISGEDAIRSFESTFKYTATDPGNKSSRIHNFKKGIQAFFYNLDDQPTQTLVKDITFDNQPRAMMFSGYSDSYDNLDGNSDWEDIGLYITGNKINLPESWNGEILELSQTKWGIRLEGCADFIVSNNEIKGGWTDNTHDGLYYTPFHAIQARVNNGLEGFSYIQNNPIGDSSSKFLAGIYAFEDNTSLQILCNTISDNASQIGYAYKLNSGTNTPVALLQGNCLDFDELNPETGPAGNSLPNLNLSPIPGTNHTQFSVSTNNDIFYSHVNTVNPQVSNSPAYPGDMFRSSCIDEPVCNAYGNGLSVDNDPAPNPGTPTPCCINIMRSAYMDIETEMQQNMDLLTKYNRSDDATIIEAAGTIAQVLNIINSYDVYLSDAELVAVTDKLNIATTNAVVNVLTENAPLSIDVLQALTDRINSLPWFQRNWLYQNYNNQINSLYEHTAGMSLRLEKEMEVYQLSVAQKETVPTTPLACCRTSPFTNLFELNYAINNTSLNRVWFQQLLVKYAIDNNLYRNAQFALSQINTDNNEELADYVAVQQLRINMKILGKNLEDLSESEIALLESIAGNNTLAGITARNAILALNDSIPGYETPGIPVEQSLKKAAKPVNPLLNLETPGMDALVHPVPAKNVLFINTHLLNVDDEQIEVNIYDLNGVLMDSFTGNSTNFDSIDVSNISQGAYYVEVKSVANKLLERSKILIIK